MKEISAGVDSSLTGTGVAVFHEDGSVQTLLISTSGKKGDTLKQRFARLEGIVRDAVGFIPPGIPVAIEQPAYSATGGSHHDRSALWWFIVSSLMQTNPVTEVAPTTLKKFATGKGGAGKDQMVLTAGRRFPDADIPSNDVADAIHLANMAARKTGKITSGPTNKPALEALDVPNWSL